jgi:hypothetical protein
MTLRRRSNFQGLSMQAIKEFLGLQDDISAELTSLRAEAIGSTTDTKTRDYSARFNERVRYEPIAAGATCIFPGATSKTQNRWIEILLIGGGTLTVVATSGQIQGAASMALTVPGFYYFQSDGLTGWWTQP